MKFRAFAFRLYALTTALFWMAEIQAMTGLNPSKMTLPGDFLDKITQDDQTLRLTLPNGRQVVGKIDQIQRDADGVMRIQGAILHPEPGSFLFERGAHTSIPAKLSGQLRFTEKATEWEIEQSAEAGVFLLVEKPAEDSFRPRAMVMPTSANVRPAPGMSREEAESALHKDLKIEQTAPGKLRLGLVELDQEARTIRFPAIVNMTAGTVEYGVVTSTGKCHESLFSTPASPRDIHLAMLLLGVKPAKCAERPDKGLSVPETAAVRVSVAWELDGGSYSHALADLFTSAGQASAGRVWLYNGSRFNGAGFGAMVEGSIVSLIPDENALINNPGGDRNNDESHGPNIKLLPGVGAPVTISISANPSVPKTKSADP